jgi:hypothetical protein
MLRRIALLAVFALTTTPTAGAEPCAPSAKGVTVCGQGDAALTVLADTLSPSAKLAVAWRRTKDAPRSERPDASHVEHHLVRLGDGTILGPVIGRAWNDGEMQSNHVDAAAAWSPDERWLLLADTARFDEIVALVAYAVDEVAGTVTAQPQLDAVKTVADRGLRTRVGRKAFELYELRLPDQAAIKLTNAGQVTLPLEFHIPKEDKRHGLVATFEVSLVAGRIVSSRVDVRFVRK